LLKKKRDQNCWSRENFHLCKFNYQNI